jgi:ankyrin repeat protein
MRLAIVAALAVLSGGCGSGAQPPVEPVLSASSSTPTPDDSRTSAGTTDREPRDPSLDLPLISASAQGDPARVRRLLTRGASVRATDQRGRTPLVEAAYGNRVRVARVLVSAGADPNEKDTTVQSAYLISTSEVGDDPRLLRLLLGNGADVSSRDSFNGTGLIRAAERGFPGIIERLLDTDIEIDHVNRLGWTALHEAIILGDGGRSHTEVVRLLVEAGADVNLPSARDGVRPLTHAQQRGYEEIAQILRNAGARP